MQSVLTTQFLRQRLETKKRLGFDMSERLDVLRLGYRKGSDPRITTHLALVARAMGADGFLLAGDEDNELFENLNSVNSRFGGGLKTNHVSGLGHLRRSC